MCKQQNVKSNNLGQKGNFLEDYQSSRTRQEAENCYFTCLLLSGPLAAERLEFSSQMFGGLCKGNSFPSPLGR